MVGTLYSVFIQCDETKHILQVVVLLNACVVMAEHVIFIALICNFDALEGVEGEKFQCLTRW